ncbi:hypothetical protein QP248_02650 [Aerococcus sp. UMB8608]|uniref:Uncharacterized protein n=1 Tax=Aerococcus sanguinicola TaxID=119206 RepID=A0A109RDN6_9LACT|nr:MULTISPECIES: hypothetical protein [Aerococcus]AMB94901.1 hypothetical protein AWM72_09100 [Aerococcus sanguinicola]MDK6679349.1 hypothetical protein [Aerococcus sp. UMB8608]MDK6685809.1 hypothetical protein [Aerococcus sp. UMB8623]OFT95886.1 hypothetical protein HMPREF3090_03435 [Aerococcus sp. HMSC23C02]
MTYSELIEALETLGWPIAYNHFDEAPKPPYMAIMDGEVIEFKADNIVYHMSGKFGVELYTEYKDFEAEKKLEKVLADAKYPYDVLGDFYNEDDNIYQRIYEVMIDGR